MRTAATDNAAAVCDATHLKLGAGVTVMSSDQDLQVRVDLCQAMQTTEAGNSPTI